MLQAYEGYLEKGKFYPIGPPVRIEGRRRVIITILDGSMREKLDSWAEFDKIISDMDEKPRLEDFQRCQSGRGLINFEEV